MCKVTPNSNTQKVPVKDKVRVSANLDPEFSNLQYIMSVHREWEETNAKRLRRHQLNKKLIRGFLDLMRPVSVEDHSLVSSSFHHVMNLLYPMVEIDKEEEN